VITCTLLQLMVVLQSNRLLKIENLEGLVMLEQLYLSDNGIEVIEGLETLVSHYSMSLYVCHLSADGLSFTTF